ncbi:hypothetical protein AX16_010103, partial [Volvariella volvacea WC 439]
MLMVVDPRRRCLLHQVVDEESVNWTTDELLEAFGCRASDKEVEETMLGGNKLKRSAVSTDYSGGSETSGSSGFSEDHAGEISEKDG